MFLEILKMAGEALFANKVRSFLSVLGIIIGVSTVIVVVGIGTGAQKQIADQYKNLSATTIMVMKQMGRDAVSSSKLAPEDSNLIAQNVANIKDKYLSMLIKVKAWQPPTVDHNELKEFMIKQIVDSINWDCDISHVESPVLLDGKTWLAERIDSCSWDINYHAKEYQKEVDRCAVRTLWIVDLKKSLFL